MIELRCKICNSKMLECNTDVADVEIVCRKSDCKAKNRFVIYKNGIVATILHKKGGEK